MIKRLGFACKWIDRPDQVNNIKSTDAAKALNTSTTTVRWLNEHRDQAEDRLWSLAKNNIEAARRLVERVGSLDEQLRMVRLGSDLLPVFTEPTWRHFWQQPDVRRCAERAFMEVGELARGLDVRLSFHPGQFCCVVSDNPDVVSRSIDELEYHADMIRWMGFGQRFQDFKCNVHLSGRLGVDGFDAAWQRMSPELRNCLTLENDEYQQNINSLIKLKDKVAIVLDIHHHLISDCEYISNTDERIKHISDSWRGVRPVIHYSQSREEYLRGHEDCLPEMSVLLKKTTKSKLRAHSDFYNNVHINAWALTHLEWADMMSESKSKNLGAAQLFNQLRESI